MVFGADRVLFSVDWPYAPNTDGRRLLDIAPLSPDDLDRLAHGNAERLLGLALAPVALRGAIQLTPRKGVSGGRKPRRASFLLRTSPDLTPVENRRQRRPEFEHSRRARGAADAQHYRYATLPSMRRKRRKPRRRQAA